MEQIKVLCSGAGNATQDLSSHPEELRSSSPSEDFIFFQKQITPEYYVVSVFIAKIITEI